MTLDELKEAVAGKDAKEAAGIIREEREKVSQQIHVLRELASGMSQLLNQFEVNEAPRKGITGFTIGKRE